MKKLLNSIFVFFVLLTNTPGCSFAQLPQQTYAITDQTYGRVKSAAVLAGDGFIRRISTTNTNDPYWPEPYKLRLEKIDPTTGLVVSDIHIVTSMTLSAGIEEAVLTPDGNIIFACTELLPGTSVSRTRLIKISLTGQIIFNADAGLSVAGFGSQLITDLYVSPTGFIYVTGSIIDSLANRNSFLWKSNASGVKEFFRDYKGVTWYSIAASVLEVQDKIIVGIKPYNSDSYLMLCNSLNGDSIGSINIGQFVPNCMTMVQFPLVTVAGHQMTGTVGLNFPGILKINLQSTNITPNIISTINGSFSELVKTANGMTAAGFCDLSGATSIFAAWLNTEGAVIDSNFIGSGGLLHSMVDEIIILSNRKTVILAREVLPPTPPPPGLPLPWVYHNTGSYIAAFKALPCTQPVALITPDTVFNCFQNPFELQSTDTTNGNIYKWKRYSNVLAETGHTLQETRNGIYKLYVTSNTWCTKIAPDAIVIDITPAGTVTASGPVNFCSGDSVTLSVMMDSSYNYQWYKDGTLIPGAVYVSYTTGVQGKYKCIITTVTGCSRVSQKVFVTVNNCGAKYIPYPNSLEDQETQAEGICVYPNPASQEISISGSMAQGQIMIFDMLGTVVMEKNCNLPAKMDIKHLQPGIYTVRIGNKTRRFIKE